MNRQENVMSVPSRKPFICKMLTPSCKCTQFCSGSCLLRLRLLRHFRRADSYALSKLPLEIAWLIKRASAVLTHTAWRRAIGREDSCESTRPVSRPRYLNLYYSFYLIFIYVYPYLFLPAIKHYYFLSTLLLPLYH